MPTVQISGIRKRLRDDDDEGDEGDVPGAKVASLEPPPENLLKDTFYDEYWTSWTVTVGSSKVPFILHPRVVSKRCPMLFRHLQNPASIVSTNGHRESAEQDEATFEKTSLETFRIFAAWLYRQELIPPSKSLSGRSTSSAVQADISATHRLVQKKGVTHRLSPESDAQIGDLELVQLFKFGEDWDIPSLSNSAITTLALQNDVYARTTAKGAIDAAFASGGKDSHLRQFLVEEAAFRLNDENVSEAIHAYPPEFVTKFLRQVLRQRDRKSQPMRGSQWRRHLCQYHEHGRELRGSTCERDLKSSSADLVGKPPFSYDFRKAVTVRVGPTLVPFVVHEDLICSASTFFKGAFRGRFLEGETKSVDLSEESVQDFAFFVRWLYTDSLRVPHSDDFQKCCVYQMRQSATQSIGDSRCSAATPLRCVSNANSVDGASMTEALKHPANDVINRAERYAGSVVNSSYDDSLSTCANPGTPIKEDAAEYSEEDATESVNSNAVKYRRHQGMLVDLFIFADRRDIPCLRNRIMDVFTRHREEGRPLLSTVRNVKLAYAYLQADSKLCAYLAEEAAYCWGEEIEPALDFFPKEFTAAVIYLMLKWARRKDGVQHQPLWRVDLCEFHDHEEDANRVKCCERNASWQSSMKGKNNKMVPVHADYL